MSKLREDSFSSSSVSCIGMQSHFHVVRRRKFLLVPLQIAWLSNSFQWILSATRYIPVGLMEHLPQRLNWRPPPYVGRDALETLMGRSDVAAWVDISEKLLGKTPEGFEFLPKHKSNSYEQVQDRFESRYT